MTKYRIVPRPNLKWGIQIERVHKQWKWVRKRLFGIPLPFVGDWVEEEPDTYWEYLCDKNDYFLSFNSLEEAKCFIDLEIKAAEADKAHLAIAPIEYP